MFCPHCGKEIAEGQAFCQHCGGAISAQPSAPTRTKTAWEDRASLGFFRGLFTTIKESLFHPAQFFRAMPVTGGLADPLAYALITGMVGMTISYAWQIVLEQSFSGFMPADMRTAAGYQMFQGIGMAFIALIIPFAIIVALFLWTGILHVCLLLVRGATNGFEASFRAVAYSYGANIFMAVPLCGGLIALVWSMVLAIIGLKEAHGTSGGKASFAVLFPLMACCGIIILMALLLVGSLAASFGSMSHQWK